MHRCLDLADFLEIIIHRPENTQEMVAPVLSANVLIWGSLPSDNAICV